jgi:hypothetical protein
VQPAFKLGAKVVTVFLAWRERGECGEQAKLAGTAFFYTFDTFCGFGNKLNRTTLGNMKIEQGN